MFNKKATIEKTRIPCRVEIVGDVIVFKFKDEYEAEIYQDHFPFPEYTWICFDGYMNAFECKRGTIH